MIRVARTFKGGLPWQHEQRQTSDDEIGAGVIENVGDAPGVNAKEDEQTHHQDDIKKGNAAFGGVGQAKFTVAFRALVGNLPGEEGSP